ncbi:diguanylate cyclase (GGDEF) domain-containing protein [Acetitomaculum ruminis DSM 5522]|uniref:Diguanylate cyclase (GGDEF) domain-containing protein n=1 Tax=Acetitomaculum ruminis DSM 5522 TaxID=1120918 RepID=A0A1I0XGB5_9FIRM|nr:EAL domain-containing protein [Acetitomaculum ruminis]SFB00031.1 diguanylate cyclase (GGDEF) domain-containing protein [Acetitomaculum ruminis DSM 5522]
MNDSFIGSREKYLLENFERALNLGWIEIYSQPVVRASTGRVCEEELFARWDDPALGILNPFDFIPVLEKNGVVERLDLYILERAIENIQIQSSVGVNFATTSINISLSDFHNKDFVKEIEDRVCASGISREKFAFELSESTVLVENEEIAVQLEKLEELGYRLEIDDFGYNCIPLMLSSKIHFDALKLNMTLIRNIPTSKESVIIVDGLLKMAAKLGIDVIAKGVERKEQVDLLCDIGCTKLQGFYYSRPVSTADLYNYAKSNKPLFTVEDAREEDYYAQVDGLNIHELSSIRGNNEGFKNNNNEDPMAILEIDDDEIRVIRINDACKGFISKYFPGKEKIRSVDISSQLNLPGAYVLSEIRKCIQSDQRIIVEDTTPTGKTAHLLVQKVAQNPVSRCTAVIFAVISVDTSLKNSTSLSYNYIARALCDDYVAMYIVDIETNNYVEYHMDGLNRNITVEKIGKDFFYDAHNDVENKTYHEDKSMFNELCTKENMLRQIAKQGVFSIIYRAEDEVGIRYVNFKAVLDKSDDKHIIIGVHSVDKQIKLQQDFKSLQEERIIFSRIAALFGDFFAIYTINLENNTYSVYKTLQGERYIGENKAGEDFFAETQMLIKEIIHPDDLQGFKKNIKKENILESIAKEGFFQYQYRLIVDGKPTFFRQKAVIITENDEEKLIIGLINVDAQVKKEKEYAQNLSVAENMALKDELTGVNNKHAYTLAEKKLADSLKEDKTKRFVIVVFDLNDLKYINDNFGHKKGDEYIKSGCKIICETFEHSPVFRIGGDEFVAIVQGRDFENIDYLMRVIEKKNNDNKLSGDVTIAAGMAFGTNNSIVNDVFVQADANMYEKKKKMKSEYL